VDGVWKGMASREDGFNQSREMLQSEVRDVYRLYKSYTSFILSDSCHLRVSYEIGIDRKG
jgi:hypothetical protein